MEHKTLVLVLAAGEGSRIRDQLQEDEPVTAMIKTGNRKLIDFVLDSLAAVDVENADLHIAILSYPEERYSGLERKAANLGLRVLTQKAKHRKLPYMLELPYILYSQFHRSNDSMYLQGFNSIVTLPVDKVIGTQDINGLLNLHFSHLRGPQDRQVTMLSRKGFYQACKAELFRTVNDEVVERKKYDGISLEGYELVSQAGVFAFSRGFLQHPILSAIQVLGGSDEARIFRYLGNTPWMDYGRPETLSLARSQYSKPF